MLRNHGHGMVHYNTNSATGTWTAKQLEDFAFDLMLCSCARIFDGNVYERSLDQKEIKRTAFARSQKHILLIDHTKFNAQGAYRLTQLENYDLVVTDDTPPKELLARDIKFIY